MARWADAKVSEAVWKKGARRAVRPRAGSKRWVEQQALRRSIRAGNASRALRESAIVPSGGKNKTMINKMLAKKGKLVAGGVAAAGGIGYMMNRRTSGLDPVRGRPTGPYMY